MKAPHRIPAQPWPPTDPFIYRLYEAVMLYGPAFKDVAHEIFGDGIMSAIDMSVDIEKGKTRLESRGWYDAEWQMAAIQEILRTRPVVLGPARSNGRTEPHRAPPPQSHPHDVSLGGARHCGHRRENPHGIGCEVGRSSIDVPVQSFILKIAAESEHLLQGARRPAALACHGSF